MDCVEFRGGQVLTRESSKLLGGVCLMGLLTKMSIHCLFYLYIVLSGGFSFPCQHSSLPVPPSRLYIKML